MRLRLPTIALALVAGIAFASSVQGGHWWVIGGSEIGPFGATRCEGCGPAGLSWLGAGEQWIRFGVATWAAGMIAMVVLLVLAAAVAAKRVPRLVAKMTLVAIVTAVITGAIFFAKFPRDVFPADIARGIWLFVIAIVLGSAAAIMVLRQR
ncbi:MAG: hypothetical protein ABI867_42395 [Kofleriaceae bacterium]